MNKEKIEQYHHTLWNEKDLSAIERLFSKDAIIHSPLGQFKTPGQMREVVQKWITAIPDIHVEPIHTLEDQGIVTSHWKAKGTFENNLANVVATKSPVEYQGVTLYRFSGEKVIEYWAYLDSWSLEKQMNEPAS